MNAIEFARHAPIGGFDVVDGQLVVGGLTLQRLRAAVGATPFYAYSRTALGERVRSLRAALPASLRINYAMKANPMPAVVQCMAGWVDGIDVASSHEMRVALDTGMAASRISFAGPGKREPELAQAVASGVTIVLESANQYARACRAATRIGVSPRLAIRINPAYELKSSGMKMGGGAKPFGIDEEQVPQLLAQMRTDGVSLTGFHIFAGSQNLNAASIIESQTRALELARRMLGSTDHRLEWLNIGGGFGVPYFPGERALDVTPIAQHLHNLNDQAIDCLGVPLTLELGRYLVAEAGVYVCSIIDRKVSQGRVFLVADGGLHHNLAASGNFGQVLRKNYPVAIGNRIGQGPLEEQTVTGPLCTPLDIVADRMMLPVADVGDLVVVFLAGAYGPSASPIAFLSHPAPLEVLV